MSKRVTRIDELAQNVPPPRDLWPGIAAAIEAGKPAAASDMAAVRRRTWLPATGLAAAVALVAIGMVIGMRLKPEATAPGASTTAHTEAASDPRALPAAYVRDQKYRAQRDALLVEVQNRMQAMAPADRAKVAASLAALKTSIAEIEAQLGKDPANALLQELLVSSCQEEMRALTAVRDSGSQES